MDFLVAPIAVAGIAGIMATLVALVDMVANNYGEVTIDVNEGKKEMTVRGGSPLLLTLSTEGLYLPSACGGRGSCGACKCRIISDIGPYLPTEIPYLLPEELKQNIRLACQIKVKTNIGIEIPEDLFNVKQFSATVTAIKDLTYDIKEVLFELGDDTIDFEAGKYVQLVIPPYDKIKESTQRAYSMSSSPSNRNQIELLVRLVPGGIATTYVHQHLEVGQKLDLIGPFGDFCRTASDAIMLCIAGGSGMAPFKSMFYDMLDKDETNREIWYFFGARTTKDMFYLDEMRELEKQLSDYHFIPALSEPQEGDGWEGPTGLITDVLDRYLKETIETEGKVLEGYLCGSPGMIDACNRVMNDNGVIQDNVYYDKFA
ncbi:Na(+)-translocating NADH-quinone reductase subunit F [Olavius algarvensis spirochete endosymbiont]|uniref:NADH:ubiquinone reductase (Na(+)-transporting) subunit F n=1 Tax=Olavius algarvensis spirochete endosymbiont TaxID=260710 RepID=UPI000F2024E7|nr:2Fe-2S iron-sulfur cluster binding domain-containing protein [Olavius algarvensis spirochete endosymbiont]CAD7846066.1 MAG: Na(+)-translocating NADH-quinone reductase subunit F (EC 1.6.5.8) [Olavius algarvensis spirochete endosymbiont]VDA99228.1 Na(+)-translocating NADH-quinone reductase subunit F [Olavius algarvensis spirochete endosymbiont]